MDTFLDDFEQLLFKHNLVDSIPEVLEAIIEDYPNTYFGNFFSRHISAIDATQVAFSNPSICEEYFQLNKVSPELIAEHLKPNDFACYMTFEQSDKATELLDELLYYRNMGRI